MRNKSGTYSQDDRAILPLGEEVSKIILCNVKNFEIEHSWDDRFDFPGKGMEIPRTFQREIFRFLKNMLS